MPFIGLSDRSGSIVESPTIGFTTSKKQMRMGRMASWKCYWVNNSLSEDYEKQSVTGEDEKNMILKTSPNILTKKKMENV